MPGQRVLIARRPDASARCGNAAGPAASEQFLLESVGNRNTRSPVKGSLNSTDSRCAVQTTKPEAKPSAAV